MTTGSETDGLIARVRRYVEIETPSGYEPGMRALADRIVADLVEVGAEVERIGAPGAGDNIVARWPAPDSDRRPILLLCHYDTVHPVGTLERFPFRIEDGRAYGPGVFDMKTSIALVVEAMRSASAPRPVVALITCDEETGSATSRGLIERTALECDAVLVMEPALPDGSAKTARKGVGSYLLRLHGRPAHAGVEPEKGIDAIVELAHQIIAIHALADPSVGTTITVGPIVGGTTSNVIADYAEAEIDVRHVTPAEGARVDAALRRIAPRDARVRLVLEGGLNRPPLVRTAAVERLYQQARAQAAEIGFDMGEGSTGGGSDGSFTASVGVPTLDGLGTVGAGAHTLEEYIELGDLERRVALLRRLIEHVQP